MRLVNKFYLLSRGDIAEILYVTFLVPEIVAAAAIISVLTLSLELTLKKYFHFHKIKWNKKFSRSYTIRWLQKSKLIKYTTGITLYPTDDIARGSKVI